MIKPFKSAPKKIAFNLDKADKLIISFLGEKSTQIEKGTKGAMPLVTKRV